MVKNQIFTSLTTKATNLYTARNFKDGDFLVFGSETKGIDDSFLKSIGQILVQFQW